MGTKNTRASAAQMPVKRNAATAGLATEGRTVKRRASRACQCCRSRKVRCDVVESGIPCTNCRLDEVQCTVPEGKRRRKSTIDTRLPRRESSALAEKDTGLRDRDRDFAIPPVFQEGLDLDSVGNVHEQSHILDQRQEDHGLGPIHTSGMSTVDFQQSNPFEMDLSKQQPNLPFKDPIGELSLPKYLQPIPQHMLKTDLSYLASRSALQLPGTGLRNELLRCYVQYVHPYLPLLDLHDFILAIDRNDGRDPISLLLFQAVMFAGTGFIDKSFLIAEGFESRKSARRAFFRRVKLLYDFDYEDDRVTVIQAVLLMTYWYDTPDDQKDVWHWLGIAISLGSTIGINNDSFCSGLDRKSQTLRRRLWWCCYLRDRLISLGMRRPLQIRDGHFSVGMLVLDDFETTAMPVEESSLLGICPAVQDSSKRVALAKLCLALINLCKCISQVLDLQYCLTGQKHGSTKTTTVRLVPRQSVADSSDILHCDRTLEDWYLSTPPELHYFFQSDSQTCSPTPAAAAANDDGESAVYVHRSLLTGVYLTTVSALHRPCTLVFANDATVVPELKERSGQRIREAADKIAEMYKDLYTKDLIQYLPNTAVTILLSAQIVHFLDLKSEDIARRQASGKRFQICMTALHRLREMYASADYAFSLLDTLVRRAQIEIPVASPLTSTTAAATSTATARRNNSLLSDPTATHSPVIVTYDNNYTNSPPMLTPPPEATWTAKKLLFSSTLAPEERNLIAAIAGQGSNSSHDKGGSSSFAQAMSMGMGLRGSGPAAGAPSETDDDDENDDDNDQEDEYQPENDFDALLNLDGYGHVDAADESGIFAEMNLAWLNGMDVKELPDGGSEQTPDHDAEAGDGSRCNDPAGGEGNDNQGKEQEEHEEAVLREPEKDQSGLSVELSQVVEKLDGLHRG